MSLVHLDPVLLYTVGYLALGVAASLVLYAVSADRFPPRPRKGQQHPLGWRKSAKS